MRQTLDREDSPEMIQACLNCTKPAGACNACAGPVVRRKERKAPIRRKGFPEDVRVRAMALVDSGMKVKFAAREAGVGESTLSAWLAARRREIEEERRYA